MARSAIVYFRDIIYSHQKCFLRNKNKIFMDQSLQSKSGFKKLSLVVILGAVFLIGLFLILRQNRIKVVENVVTQPMKIASYYWPGQYWVEVAHSKGFFREESLAVELVDTNQNYTESLDHVASGKLDTQNFYLFDLMVRRDKGAPLKMVLSADVSNGSEAIVATGGINSLAELKDKRVAVEQGGVTEYMLFTLLKQNKMELADVVLISDTTEKLPARLKNGDVDAVVLWEPLVTEALEAPGAKKLWDSSQAPGIASAGYVFSEEFLTNRSADVEKFVNVWNRTTEYIESNPEESYKIVARYNNDLEENVKAYTLLDTPQDYVGNLKAFSFSGGFKSLYSQIKLINLYLQSQGLIKQDIEPADILEPEYIKGL